MGQKWQQSFEMWQKLIATGQKTTDFTRFCLYKFVYKTVTVKT